MVVIPVMQLADAMAKEVLVFVCLLYTSDAADERSSVDLGGRRIIKKKKNMISWCGMIMKKQKQQEYSAT